MNDAQITGLLHQVNDGHFVARALHVVAELGVADFVGADGAPMAHVAERVGAKPDLLARVVRLLASRGIFRLEGGLASGRIYHTPASERLATAHPTSFRPFVRNTATIKSWRLPEHMTHMVRTGEPAVGEGTMWSQLEASAEDGRLFDAAMTAKSHTQIAGLLKAYDFSGLGRVVDVGGGAGHLLRAILAANPAVDGILFDRPDVVAAAATLGADERLEFVGGSFFDDVPAGDATLLMEVLHDWSDEECVRILKTIRRRAEPGSRLLVVEADVGEGDGPNWGKLLDVIMMTLFAGRQRTRSEFEALFAASGYRLTEVIPTDDGSRVFVGMPV
jgi:SAM-dependent methyltransferase